MLPSATGLLWSPAPSRCCVGVVIRDASAPTDYHVALDLPPGTMVEDADDGALRIDGNDYRWLASVAAPWAYDAAGRPVPVSQHWNGDGVVLRVHHDGARYPVLADPQFDWGWVSGTLYFTREETRNARDASALAGMVSGACPHPACRVVALAAGGLALVAARLHEDGKCLKIKLVPRPYPPFYLPLPGATKPGGRNCH